MIVSGQGPYFGQAVWFTKFHPETLPSAQERYYKEIKRVTSVLEGHLSKQEKGTDGPWLVGGKYSYADMAFVPWQSMLVGLKEKVDMSEFKEVTGWVERMMKREAVEESMKEAFGGH
jgi:glutathione S-transferase